MSSKDINDMKIINKLLFIIWTICNPSNPKKIRYIVSYANNIFLIIITQFYSSQFNVLI